MDWCCDWFNLLWLCWCFVSFVFGGVWFIIFLLLYFKSVWCGGLLGCVAYVMLLNFWLVWCGVGCGGDVVWHGSGAVIVFAVFVVFLKVTNTRHQW